MHNRSIFKQPSMCLRLLTTTSGNPDTSTHIDLASDQPRGLAVTWTVHFLQRQPAVTMDNIFLQGGRIAPVATKWSVTLYRRLAVSIDCVFLADANRIAPVATNNGLLFLAGGNRCSCCRELWTAILQLTHGIAPPRTFVDFLQRKCLAMAWRRLGGKRLTENPANCSVLECMSLLACCENRSPGSPICRGVLRRAATTLPSPLFDRFKLRIRRSIF